MKKKTIDLIPIPGKPKSIIISDNGNMFASVDECGYIKIFGEDMSISIEEARDILKIANNFDLFYKNIKTQ